MIASNITPALIAAAVALGLASLCASDPSRPANRLAWKLLIASAACVVVACLVAP